MHAAGTACDDEPCLLGAPEVAEREFAPDALDAAPEQHAATADAVRELLTGAAGTP